MKKETVKEKVEREVKEGTHKPCKDYIFGGCGFCPPECHQPKQEKEHA
jgi:hypothetical protein